MHIVQNKSRDDGFFGNGTPAFYANIKRNFELKTENFKETARNSLHFPWMMGCFYDVGGYEKTGAAFAAPDNRFYGLP